MNSQKWTCFAIGYQCGFAYAIALMVNQFGALLTGSGNVPVSYTHLDVYKRQAMSSA